jgi:hypothetical protein
MAKEAKTSGMAGFWTMGVGDFPSPHESQGVAGPQTPSPLKATPLSYLIMRYARVYFLCGLGKCRDMVFFLSTAKTCPDDLLPANRAAKTDTEMKSIIRLSALVPTISS